jgi:hypothetical protein
MFMVRVIWLCWIELPFHWIYFPAEWTATLIKFLKDQLNRLQDFYHQSGGNVSGAANTGANSTAANTGVVNCSATGGSNAPGGGGGGNNGSSTATPVASVGGTSCTNAGVNTNASSGTVQPAAVNSAHAPANASLPVMTEEQKLAQRQWQYCVQLAKYLYEVSGTGVYLLANCWKCGN